MATIKVTRKPRDVTYTIEVSTSPGKTFGPYHFGDAVREAHKRSKLSEKGAYKLVIAASTSRDSVTAEFG